MKTTTRLLLVWVLKCSLNPFAPIGNQSVGGGSQEGGLAIRPAILDVSRLERDWFEPASILVNPDLTALAMILILASCCVFLYGA